MSPSTAIAVAFGTCPIRSSRVNRADTCHLQALRRRSFLLLAVVAAWLVSVTVCTVGLDDAPAASEVHEHAAGADHPHAPDDECACKTSSAFTAQSFTVDLAKVSAPRVVAVPVFESVGSILFSTESTTSSDSVVPFTRPPPARWCFAGQILQDSLLSRAPPCLIMI